MDKLTVTADETALRLSNLQEYVPDADETTCAFGRYIAARLDSEVTPAGFMVACMLGLNHWPMGDYKTVHDSIMAQIPKIVDAIFPIEFAKEVRDSNDRREAFMRERGRRTAGDYPLIIPGARVETTKANAEVCDQIHEVVWGPRQWGVQGVVVARNDWAGLCFNVQHPDETVGCYDPSELKMLEPAA